ncbi:MAG: thiosulfate oxidation carrier complex protein SoxZ [Rhodospirillales bacterium]|nr:thiosulfate oxidation carrier complex protein SoxZ [Rhodospirillales bacterium]MDE0379315.1 thiosulfate oxidation carrier complex protein SoxZ [Rhodospirillales bacterium]
MAEPTPRVKLPRSIEAGVPFTVKTRITHPMHTGERHDSEGALVPRQIINRFVVSYNGEVAFSVDLEPAVSADPYIQFEMAVPEPGELVFQWTDDDGSVYTLSKRVEVD